MGKVKENRARKEHPLGCRVSIPYGKGKEERGFKNVIVRVVSIPYGKGKAGR